MTSPPDHAEDLDGLRAQLAALEAKLAQQADEQEKLLAVLGHELRNPLGAIRNALVLQRRLDPSDARFARCQAIIEGQANALIELADILRDVSRLSRSKLTVERAPIDLVVFARELTADRAERFRLELGDEPWTVQWDARRLREVLDALLERALLRCPAPGQVVLRRRDGALEICDGGAPVSTDEQALTFLAFESRPGTTPRLALELARAHGLVTLHGDTLALRDEGRTMALTFGEVSSSEA